MQKDLHHKLKLTRHSIRIHIFPCYLISRSTITINTLSCQVTNKLITASPELQTFQQTLDH